MNASITTLASFAFVLFLIAGGVHGLESCGSALEPIFSGAQGYRCVQLTITTASASTSAVRASRHSEQPP
jgi:hypothetical protein